MWVQTPTQGQTFEGKKRRTRDLFEPLDSGHLSVSPSLLCLISAFTSCTRGTCDLPLTFNYHLLSPAAAVVAGMRVTLIALTLYAFLSFPFLSSMFQFKLFSLPLFILSIL